MYELNFYISKERSQAILNVSAAQPIFKEKYSTTLKEDLSTRRLRDHIHHFWKVTTLQV